MRTNIDIDDELMAAAMKAAGTKTKKETVEEALRDYVRRRAGIAALMALQGKVEWEGDLDAMRRDE
jgi:Arc/MetJ family transcription regulator